MKRNTQVILLAVVFLGMLALAIYQAQPRAITSNAPVSTADSRITNRVFTSFEAYEVVAVRLDDTKSNVDLILTFNTEGWQIAGITEPINQEAAANIAATLALIPYVSQFGNVATSDYERFGLTTEGIWMQAQVILGSEEVHVIAIGNRTPNGDGWYALVDDNAQVYILNKGAVDYLAIYLQEIQSILASF